MKTLIAPLILGLIAAVVAEEPCMLLYRKDLLQRWIIPQNSSLCKINKPYTGAYEFGLQMKGTRFLVSSENFTVDFSDNYVSEKAGKEPFSINVYTPDTDFAHFLTINETDKPSLWGTIVSEKDDSASNAHTRTRYYVEPGAIYREGTANWRLMTLSLCIFEGMLIVICMFKNVYTFACILNFFFLVGVSLITGWIDFYSTTMLGIALAVTFVIAVTIGFLFQKWVWKWAGILLGVLMIIYYIVGGAKEQRWFAAIAGITILVEACTIGFVRGNTGTIGRRLTIVLFTVFWMQVYLFWSYIFIIYPSEVYKRFFVGPLGYRAGVKGKGFHLWMWSLITLVCVVLVSALAGFLMLKRDKKKADGAGTKLLSDK